MITPDEVRHLAALARISITDEEVAVFVKEIDAILSYVGKVKDLAAQASSEPEFSPRVNVFRKDEVTNQPDQYTEALLREMPSTEGRFLKVKKIIGDKA